MMKNISKYSVSINFQTLKDFLVYKIGKKIIAGIENIIARYSL